jgi:outer membrane protein TolC
VHASIPEIPQVRGVEAARISEGVHSAQLIARSKYIQSKGDEESSYFPELRFFMQYNRNTNLLNDVSSFFAKPLPPNNLASGVSVQIPIFDMGHRARAKESTADALRAKVEAEQAQKQNELEIADLSGSIRELDTQAEIASLKQQIADGQLKTVMAQLQLGNGTGSGPGSQPQTSPKAEQLALIDARQKTEDALDAGFELAKARLGLLRALGHMIDWLNELHGK